MGALVFGVGGCASSKSKLQIEPLVSYACQWFSVEVSQGISVIRNENPKDVSVIELTENSAGFRVKHERTLECQALDLPKELERKPPRFLYTPPVNHTPKRNKINGTHITSTK